MYINKAYRVKFKRTIWVDVIVSAHDCDDATDKALEQADCDDYDHTSAEDTDFDVEEVNE